MRWLTDQYNRLYKQIREDGKRVVCYLDCFYGDVNGNTIRDIAIIESFFQEIRIGVRKDVYTHTDQYRGEDEASCFIGMCERTHVQWLDESEEPLMSQTAKEFLIARLDMTPIQQSTLYEEYIEAMVEYARQKCEEQKKICAHQFQIVHEGDHLYQRVINAPLPKFE